MAKLTINFDNEEKFLRDIDAAAAAWGYADALTDQPNLTKQNFIERQLRDIFKNVSRQHRVQKAISELVVEE